MRRRSALALFLPLIALPAAPAAASGTARPIAPATSTAHSLDDRALPAPLELRLNELDYDQPGFDTGEFVEIVNTGTERYRLRHVALVFVNGTDSAEYRRVPLFGRLGSLRRLVVATPTVSVDPAARVIPMPLARDDVQNGSPDGVALVDTANDLVLDAIVYEGSIEDAAIDGLPDTISLMSGQPVHESDGNELPGSICRLPDHADTDDDDHDWSACAPTPGASNAATRGR
jgi:hypothetical protein